MLKKSILFASLIIPINFCLAESTADFTYKRTANLQRKLNLTDEQANKMFNLFNKQNSACDKSKSFTEMKKCRITLPKESASEFEKILNPKQKEDLKKMKAARKTKASTKRKAKE